MRTKDADVTWMVVIFFAGMAVVSWFSEQPWWLRTIVIVSAVLAAYGWWSLFRMPTTCGVANRNSARGCSNNVKGLLRACWLADHRARKQKLLWARLLGRSPHPSSAPPPSQPAAGAVRASPPAVVHSSGAGYRLEGAGYRATMLVCTLVTTACGLVSGFAAIAPMLGIGPAAG